MRLSMSAPKKRKAGRPATGITKTKPSITIDRETEQQARKAAMAEGISFSAWVERAVRANLSTVTGGITQ
jgi:predicted HicB family RNase H-like nuclease